MFVEGGLVWNEDKAEKKQAGVGKYNVRLWSDGKDFLFFFFIFSFMCVDNTERINARLALDFDSTLIRGIKRASLVCAM